VKLVILFSLIFSPICFAAKLNWICENLNLKFNEIPDKPGVEFNVLGCYQDKTYFLISNDCKSNPKTCLSRGEKNKIPHPGGGIGSPMFVKCYNIGGRPRFLQVKVNNEWINTSTCFFGSQNSFMDYDSLK
jgi:hypothetical protein